MTHIDLGPDAFEPLPEPEAPPEELTETHVLRAELVLARDDLWPLKEPGGPDFDPLQPFAYTMAELRDDLDEHLDVQVDLLPASPGRAARLRNEIKRKADRVNTPFMELLVSGRSHHHVLNPVERMERRREQLGLWRKVGEDTPLFEPQILIRVQSRSKQRAKKAIKRVEAHFHQWNGANYWKVAGINLLGLAFLGTDQLPWRRRWFDYRFETGLHWPSRPLRGGRRHATSRELEALLRPPTAACSAGNVERSGGRVAPAPPYMPGYGEEDSE